MAIDFVVAKLPIVTFGPLPGLLRLRSEQFQLSIQQVQAVPRVKVLTNNEKYINKSTLRSLRILSEYSRSSGSLGVSELVERLGMTKNLVHRTLSLLVEENLLLRDPETRRYQLGPGVLWFFQKAKRQDTLPAICAPFMKDIEAVTGMTISLQLRVGDYQIPILGIDGRRSGLARVVEGVPVPLHISSGSRAILAFLDAGEIEHYIHNNAPLKAMTQYSLVDPDALLQNLSEIRDLGFAGGIEDHFLGVHAIALPLFDRNGEAFASIVVVGAASSVGKEDLLAFIPDVRRRVDDLNRFLKIDHDASVLAPR